MSDRDVLHVESEATPILEALKRLPPRRRAVMFLKYYEDLTEREIATSLGCAVGTVRSRLNRAREAIRRACW